MPQKKTAPTTQAGEFVHEEIAQVRNNKDGARSTKQAIAIGLSKARRAGVKVPTPKKGTTSAQTRKKAEQDLEKGAKAKTAPRRKTTKAKTAPKTTKAKTTKAKTTKAKTTKAKTAPKTTKAKTTKAKRAPRKRTSAS